MYAVGDSRQKACQENGRYFSSDSNFALPKKLTQCTVCSHFGLSTTAKFCSVCSQYGIIRKNDGPRIVREPQKTDVPLFCKECSQYVLSSSGRFCLACSQHDGYGVLPADDDYSSDPPRLRTRGCFRNEDDYARFLESCSNKHTQEADPADDFTPKGHAWGGDHVYEVGNGRSRGRDDGYEVSRSRGRVADRSPQSRGRYNMFGDPSGQERGGSKSRGNRDGPEGYGGVQDSMARMVACYGAKSSHLARRTGRELPRGRSPSRSPRTGRFGMSKMQMPTSAHSMNTCADHGLAIPVAPCLRACTAHGLPLS